MHMEM